MTPIIVESHARRRSRRALASPLGDQDEGWSLRQRWMGPVRLRPSLPGAWLGQEVLIGHNSPIPRIAAVCIHLPGALRVGCVEEAKSSTQRAPTRDAAPHRVGGAIGSPALNLFARLIGVALARAQAELILEEGQVLEARLRNHLSRRLLHRLRASTPAAPSQLRPLTSRSHAAACVPLICPARRAPLTRPARAVPLALICHSYAADAPPMCRSRAARVPLTSNSGASRWTYMSDQGEASRTSTGLGRCRPEVFASDSARICKRGSGSLRFGYGPKHEWMQGESRSAHPCVSHSSDAPSSESGPPDVVSPPARACESTQIRCTEFKENHCSSV